MKIQDIVSFALKNGLKHEVIGVRTELDRYANGVKRYKESFLHTRRWDGHVGISIKDGVWYWWKYWQGDDVTEEPILLIDHIYSQNTGKSSKSYSRFFNLQDRIDQCLNTKQDEEGQACEIAQP